jgi:hypothetical protein
MSEGGNVPIDTEYQGANGDHRRGEVFEHASRMVDEARAFGSALSGSFENLTQALDLRGRVERNPIGMMFAALGVGYVLGGGLFSPTTARLLRIGVRLALVPLVKSQMHAFSGGAGERTSGSGAV